MPNDGANGLAALTGLRPARAPIATREADVPVAERERMRRAAEEFEAAFVAQMLKHAGLEGAFGEEGKDYAHLLLDKVGADVAEGVDLGVADDAYRQMISRYGARND